MSNSRNFLTTLKILCILDDETFKKGRFMNDRDGSIRLKSSTRVKSALSRCKALVGLFILGAFVWIAVLVFFAPYKDEYFYNNYGKKLVEKGLSLAGLTEQQYEECMVWALGKDYRQLQIWFYDERWNQGHEDLFILHGADDLVESMKRIGLAFLQTQEPNNLIVRGQP